MYNSTVIASQHIYLVISLHKLLNKRVDECRQLIKIRVDHREGRVCISFDCHCQVTVIMSSKKSEKMFGPGPTGPYGSYAYDYCLVFNKIGCAHIQLNPFADGSAGVSPCCPTFSGNSPGHAGVFISHQVNPCGLAEFSGYAWVEHLVRISTCTNSVILISLWT